MDEAWGAFQVSVEIEKTQQAWCVQELQEILVIEGLSTRHKMEEREARLVGRPPIPKSLSSRKKSNDF